MIDCHTHTKASDGEYTPTELLDLAISKGMKAIAITDHDTVEGLAEAEAYAKGKPIDYIPGVEIEVPRDRGQMHLLGLGISHYADPVFQEQLQEIREARVRRNQKLIEELRKMGFSITMEELQQASGGQTIGKPHFAKVFLDKGYIQTKEEMFDKYFNQYPLNQYKKSSYTAKQMIQWIQKAGGIAILAHPQKLKLQKEALLEQIQELQKDGLVGLECYHSEQTPEENQQFCEIANQLGLLITKGSDFHGPHEKPEIELDTGIHHNLVIENEEMMWEQLKEKIKEVHYG